MGNHGQEDYKDQIDGVPAVDKYDLSPAWSKANDYKKPFDYSLKESGQTVLLRRLDMGDLLKLGIAEELDFMSKELLTGDANASDESQTKAVSEAIIKGDNFGRMETMINKVVLAGVVKPKLYDIPRDEAARQAGLVYIDSVPFNDRIELFSAIFETEGLSTFREEQATGVGDVEHESGVPLSADGSVAFRSDDPERVLL